MININFFFVLLVLIGIILIYLNLGSNIYNQTGFNLFPSGSLFSRAVLDEKNYHQNIEFNMFFIETNENKTR